MGRVLARLGVVRNRPERSNGSGFPSALEIFRRFQTAGDFERLCLWLQHRDLRDEFSRAEEEERDGG